MRAFYETKGNRIGKDKESTYSGVDEAGRPGIQCTYVKERG
jgi:hypothetical protein